MKPSKYCNILMAGIVSGACIDFVFQISGWEAAIAIIIITLAACAANIYSDLEEKKLRQDREEKREKMESEIAEFRKEAFQKVLSDFMELKTVIIEKSDEQTDKIHDTLQVLMTNVVSGQNEMKKEVANLVGCSDTASKEVQEKQELIRDSIMVSLRESTDRLVECERRSAAEVKNEAELTNRALESTGLLLNEIRDKMDNLMEYQKKFAEELQTELGMTAEGVREEIRNVGGSLIENDHCIFNEVKTQIEKSYREADEKQEERKKEICVLLDKISDMKSVAEKCSDALKDTLETELYKQKIALEDLKRETGKVSRTITEKSENIINKEVSLLDKYDNLQKEYIKSMIKFSEHTKAVLTLLNDSYKHLNAILNTR